MNRFVPYVAAVLGCGANGCALTFDSTHIGVPVTMGSPAQATTTGTPFHVTRHPVFIMWGLITAASPNLEDLLSGQVANGAGVSNLRIRVRARWTDLLITGLTAGLFSPRTVTFEGNVQAGQAAPQP